MYSAIKKDGKKLYELARKGIEVSRPARDIYISSIELLGEERGDFLLKIACSKGTYIRTICHDIGAALGTGAAMSRLRRIRAGKFTIDKAHPLDEILPCISSGDVSKLLLPVDSLFAGTPVVMLGDAETRKVKNGVSISVGNLSDGIYRFYGPEDEFLMLADVFAGQTKLIKGFFEPL